MSVAVSRLLYAAPIWAGGSPLMSKNREAIERVNRLAALRMVRAYKTVSGEAATFLAGSPRWTWWRQRERSDGRRRGAV